MTFHFTREQIEQANRNLIERLSKNNLNNEEESIKIAALKNKYFSEAEINAAYKRMRESCLYIK